MKKIFLAIIFTLSVWGAFAVPAFPEKVEFRQPNNRDITVTIYLKGDEKVHWAETIDGYSLMHADDGSLVYATLDKEGNMVATDVLATEIEQRSAEVEAMLKKTPKHLHFSHAQVQDLLAIWEQVENAKSGPKTMTNVLGEKKFLVILFGFNDKPFTHSKTAFRMMFNQVGYSSNNAIGSVHDYYYDVSGGLFSLKVDVVGPFVGVYDTYHYGNTNSGYQDFAKEAVDSAAKYVNFADYDNDNDGYIDGLHIIFAGHGEEAGAGEECIWSHKWNIFNPPTYNNTIIDVYSCSPECKDNKGNFITAIGVICHELGHVFGAPDYYDTDYESSGGQYPGLGNFDIMSGGSWNRGGISPAHHNPYTKTYIYHWTTCDTIDGTSNVYMMEAIENHPNEIHRINTSTQGDFFLLENRQEIKWDKAIPGHGLLVYHIHPNAHGASVANNKHPQQIYIIAKGSTTDTFPTNTPSSYGQLNGINGVFPGAYNTRDSLTDNSVPWFRPWSKQKNNVPLRYISENVNSQRVFFCVQDASPNPFDVTAEGLNKEEILLQWTKYGSLQTMIVMNPNDSVFGTPDGSYEIGDTVNGGGIVIYIGDDNHCIIDSLSQNQYYYFKAYTIKRDGTYSDGVPVYAKTLNCDNDTWQNENFDGIDVSALPNCWEGEWSTTELLGSKVLTSNTGESGWKRVLSRPVFLSDTGLAVLTLKLHFGEGCSQSTKFKVEFRPTPMDTWTTLIESNYTAGGSTWKTIYLPLTMAGDNSRIRFSAYTDGSARISIDEIMIASGSLVHAECNADGNITPYGYTVIPINGQQTFTMTPLTGYYLDRVIMDGTVISQNEIIVTGDDTREYTIAGNGGHHTIKAFFERKNAIDLAEDNTIRITPNPTTGIVSICGEKGVKVEIFDLNGRLLYSNTNKNGTIEINMSSFPRGLYTVRYGNISRKIVKL
ncbi:MAG: M6 family metalloprotease domain-containing protein [Bacteroidales bacterium]|nr:M6 family metalloprotease domain-containing protein [Bacteroidales bacterium]